MSRAINPLWLFTQSGISPRIWFDRLLHGERWRVEEAAGFFYRAGFVDHPQAEKVVTQRWRRMAWVGIDTTANEGLTEEELGVLWRSPGVWLLLHDLMRSGVVAEMSKAG